jgi:hypothetical protein
MTPGAARHDQLVHLATLGRDVIRREPELLHPRLTVVPVDERARPTVEAAPGRRIVGHAELATAMEAVADRRRASLRVRIAELAEELVAAESRLGEATAAADQRRVDRDGFLDAAAWCESLPSTISAQQQVIANAESVLGERLRVSRDAARALDRVLDQRASADAAIAEARRQLESLVPAGPADPQRAEAARALAAQAESVEARLAEAEAEARASTERTKRAVTESEREIEQLVRAQRDRHARLAALVECLPGDARPPVDDDAIHHVASIAGGLRALAAGVDGELAGLQAEADRQQADCDDRRRRLEALRASVIHIVPEDAAQALTDLVTDGADDLVVLDDVFAGDTAGDDDLLRALEVTEPSAPLVLLSSDPTVLGWAIDLPAERGAIAGPRTVDLLTDHRSTTAVLADRELPRQHAVTSSLGDHR